MEKDKKIEILAPVGGQEQLLAAVRCGADAVYFGMKNFNARRNAENFGDETLKDTIAYCHTRGVKVYITVNTLVTDKEIEGMHEAVDEAAEAGADALIVQDLAVCEYMQRCWPDLKKFASTQMAVHNAEGVHFLQDYGFDRIVLARELSLKEIASIVQETKADCEVFVHGAHCMSVSGNCYLSSMIGGRSGNRGLCAQPCRLNWQKDGREYVLSLKDLSYMTHIRELEEAGVGSLKIEGRMKRAEYVAASVTACKDAREGKQPDLDTLQSVFSRSGFTDGYLTGKRNTDMFGYRTKEDVLSAKNVFSSLEQLYHKETQTIPIQIKFAAKTSEFSSLYVTDGKNEITVSGDAPQKAISQPLTEETVHKNLDKTGGTPFFAEKIDCSLADDPMLSFGQMNGMRREALEKLSQIRGEGPNYIKRSSPKPKLEEHQISKKGIRFRFEKKEQIFDCPAESIVCLPLQELTDDLIAKYGSRLYAEVPSILWPGDEEHCREELTRLSERGLRHVICSNVGAIQIAKDCHLTIHGGIELNILNSTAIAQYEKLGLGDVLLSFENGIAEAGKMKGNLPRGILVYGRLPLMKFRNCPGKGSTGCGDCNGNPYLTDRMKEKFPILCREKKYSELLNCVPLYIGDKRIPDFDFEVLYFTTEEKDECRHIWDLYSQKADPDFRRTGGLYFRELL